MNLQQEREPLLPLVDPSLYYTDEFIDDMLKKEITELAIVVTSWSGSALQFPRSINIGARQSRDLPHHLLYAQKLKDKGIRLNIYYLAFDNTMHFNHKDKRAVDNKILPSYVDYISSFSDIPIAKEQLHPIYLNPRYKVKEGDLIDELLLFENNQGLVLSGENTVVLTQLKQKIADHKENKNTYVIGMTSHSSSADIEQLARYLDINLIGTSKVNMQYGTKEGNKALFELAQVPYVFGSKQAKKTIDELLEDCCYVAEQSRCKKLIIKHNSSSAGKGNLDVNISDCYQDSGELNHSKVKQKAQQAIESHMHEIKDKNILAGQENFYMRKIRELGAIVEARIEGKNIVSPGSLAVVGEDGSVTVEYIYDQILLGDKGHFFGGSIGPTEISEVLQQQINHLTQKVGQTLAQQGGKGYFGLDFLIIDNTEVIVIEANIRKTGTKYPFLLANQLLNKSQLQTKTLFHDDNILLPITPLDITGDNNQFNRFISEFFCWIKQQMVSFNYESNTGAIITFDTHTSGKLGVLAIGDSKQHAKQIIIDFKAALNYFSLEYYPEQLNQINYAGVDLAKIEFLAEPDLLPLSPLTKAKGLVGLPRQNVPDVSQWDVFCSKVSSFFNKTSRSLSCCKSVEVKTSPAISIDDPTQPNSPTLFNFLPYDVRVEQRHQQSALTFAILGKTTSCDEILIMAAKQNIQAYRITESSCIVYNENTQMGYITDVHTAILDSKTNQYKIVFDSNQHPLPTVVYDYDFSKSKTISYQARGDRIINDKLFSLKKLLDKIGVVYFNPDPLADLDEHRLSFLSPLQSQLALADSLKKYAPELGERYPETLSINDANADQLFKFIKEHTSFYIKPVFSIRQSDVNHGNIFVTKNTEVVSDGSSNQRQYLLFKYFTENSTNGFDFSAKLSKVYLDQLDKHQLVKLITQMKVELGFNLSSPFLIQQALITPSLRDQSQRALNQKLRIITQYDKGKIVVSSLYGVYGGANAFSSYTGDPAIYIDAYLDSPFALGLPVDRVMAEIYSTAKITHDAVERSLKTRCSELIMDIVLTEHGILPLKVSTKPERPNLDRVSKQSHYGCHLEKNVGQRQDFIERLRINETQRGQLILSEAQNLHNNQFIPAEFMRKNEVKVVEAIQLTL